MKRTRDVVVVVVWTMCEKQATLTLPAEGDDADDDEEDVATVVFVGTSIPFLSGLS